MSVLLEPPRGRSGQAGGLLPHPTPPPGPSSSASPAERPPPDLFFAAALTVFSSAAAAWVAGGLFTEWQAVAVAMAGAGVGIVFGAAGEKSTRPALLQALAVPAAIVASAIAAALAARGTLGEVPGMVAAAVRTAGLRSPPIPFDAGWIPPLAAMFTALSAATVGIARNAGPRIALLTPAALAAGLSMFLPAELHISKPAGALGILLAALAVASSAESIRQQATTPSAEARRLAKGLTFAALGVAAVVLIGTLDFLLPSQSEPRQSAGTVSGPATPPDVLLFTVKADTPGPWRTGVLDVYDGRRWLAPPPQPPGSVTPPPTPGAQAAAGPDSSVASITLHGLSGRRVPTPVRLAGLPQQKANIGLDRRSGVLVLEKPGRRGTRYVARFGPAPEPGALAAASEPPPGVEAFQRAPAPPAEVRALLEQAPANRWERLQFVRQALLGSAVSAGPGAPAEVLPARVTALLAGGEGTPFEVVAAEALLARWAGVPSRLGYGYLGGDTDSKRPGVWSVNGRHSAAWLEAYFEGHGWVPLPGRAARAKPSFSGARTEASVKASEEIALVVYVPFRTPGRVAFYEVGRFLLGVTLATAWAAALVWAFFPWVLKLIRSSRRRRWARRRGIQARIATAYAEFRDAASDLGVGRREATPLEFLQWVDEDRAHEELAWLVTRALWGDLNRDLRPQDAQAAEFLAADLRRRTAGAAGLWLRLRAAASRASLKHPYLSELPNMWHARRKQTTVPGRKVGFRAALLSLAALQLAACGGGPGQAASPGDSRPVPAPLAPLPEEFEGFRFVREPKAEMAFSRRAGGSLVEDGRVYTVRGEHMVHGYLELLALKRVAASPEDVRRGVLGSVGSGPVRSVPIGRDLVYEKQEPERILLFWFSPDARRMYLLVARRDFDHAREVFAALLGASEGDKPRKPLIATRIYDPARGGPE